MFVVYLKFDAMKYLSLLTLSIIFFACSGPEKESDDAYKKLVDQYFEAALTQDYARLAPLLHEDVQFVGPKIADTLTKAELLESRNDYHTTFDTVYRWAEENICLQSKGEPEVLYYYMGRFHNRDLDVWVEFPIHVRARFKDQQLHRMQIFANQADIQMQLGMG